MQEKRDFPTTPMKFARLGHSGRSNTQRNAFNGGVYGLQLELGCGGGSGTDALTFEWPRSCGFTILQLQELQLQSLIYTYIEAGFPVPHHLVLPIWKSVICSFGGLSANLYKLFPSLMGCSTFYLENNGNKMDSEPGRCRRTDGKKWRCSKEVVPEHKYCERHMHRGRQRSRKLVEASSLENACTSLSISLPAATVSSSSTSNDRTS